MAVRQGRSYQGRHRGLGGRADAGHHVAKGKRQAEIHSTCLSALVQTARWKRGTILPLDECPPAGGSHGKLHQTTKILSHAERQRSFARLRRRRLFAQRGALIADRCSRAGEANNGAQQCRQPLSGSVTDHQSRAGTSQDATKAAIRRITMGSARSGA